MSRVNECICDLGLVYLKEQGYIETMKVKCSALNVDLKIRRNMAEAVWGYLYTYKYMY